MNGIEICNLCKTYLVKEQQKTILNHLNLTIEQGKITVILGKSGCGKTTLLRVIAKLEGFDEGKIVFKQREKTAFVFQESRLMPWLNVKENIAFSLDQSEIKKELIQDLIGMIHLEDFANAYPHQLSGGMKQRVAIARAFAYQPSFILMDEPFAALDYFTREQMQLELLKLQQQQKTSILFVTHSIDEALRLADTIVILENGKVKEQFEVCASTQKRDLLQNDFIHLKKEIIESLKEKENLDNENV